LSDFDGSSRNRGIAKKIAIAAIDPSPPSKIKASRQGIATNSNAAVAGTVIFPMSPAKL
jgi:hypothetical protein